MTLFSQNRSRGQLLQEFADNVIEYTMAGKQRRATRKINKRSNWLPIGASRYSRILWMQLLLWRVHCGLFLWIAHIHFTKTTHEHVHVIGWSWLSTTCIVGTQVNSQSSKVCKIGTRSCINIVCEWGHSTSTLILIDSFLFPSQNASRVAKNGWKLLASWLTAITITGQLANHYSECY